MKQTQTKFFVGEAPGRLDVMGGIADYSGSLVLQMPIKQSASVKMSLRDDNIIRITSNQLSKEEAFEINIKDLVENGTVNYKRAQLKIKENKNGAWASYLVGCILVLITEQKINFSGADIVLESTVPLGKGVSSSAAIEVATLKALKKAFELNFDETLLPIYGQKAENLVVGAPCGLMDQLASYFGKEGYLLPILCQPDKLFPLVKIPNDIYFVGFDSGVKHNVSGVSYGAVRAGAFMGYTIIAMEHGSKISDLEDAYHSRDWTGLPFGGYLANVSPEEFESLAKVLPDNISGEEFKKKYGFIIDNVSEIHPDHSYSVKNCTKHPIYENNRIKLFHSLFNQLETGSKKQESLLKELGSLMNESHRSYTACDLGHPNTDEIHNMINNEGTSKGVFGARITGGGSGGTVCALVQGEQGMETLKSIKKSYDKKFLTDIILIS